LSSLLIGTLINMMRVFYCW